jgi:Osmosensitive K+ channel histidine kinase
MPKGEVFRNGKWVVFIVGVTKLYDLATGINSQILLNSKFYRFSLIAIFLLSILAIASNYLLIPRFGIEGAAAATLISIFLFNSLLLGFIYMKFKIQPFSLQTLKLLLLVALLYIGMSFFPEISNPFLSIGVKTIILTCLFVGFVYFTRISEDINELIRNILQRIKLLKP